MVVFTGSAATLSATSRGLARGDRLVISSPDTTQPSRLSYYFEIIRGDIASTTYFDIKGSYNASSSSGLNLGPMEGYSTR